MEDPRSEKAVGQRSLSRKQREVLCEEFGLDIHATKDLTIEFGAGFTMVRWTGAKALDASATRDLMARLGAVE